MSKFKTVILGSALALSAFGAAAQHGAYHHHPAGSATPQIDRVMTEQAQRIQWGIQSGRLTRVEARQLQRQQRDILRLKQVAFRDGHVTGAERRDLRELQARAGNDIDRALRNARQQDDRRYGYGRG
jgi:hypothetical protein